MKIRIHIDTVDGQSNFNTGTDNALEAKKFLDSYDHEGSSVSIDIEADGEEVYKLLGWIMTGGKNDG